VLHRLKIVVVAELRESLLRDVGKREEILEGVLRDDPTAGARSAA
jgi:hypothetical protein